MYSKITVVANLGRDPEMRYLQDGTAVTNFSVAVSGRDKVDGEWKEVTTWWRVNSFGKLAENCNQYLSKGKKVLVEGEPKIRQYEKKDGTNGISLEINASNVVFLSPKNGNGGSEIATNPEVESEEPPF